jgi:hypothetical protein
VLLLALLAAKAQQRLVVAVVLLAGKVQHRLMPILLQRLGIEYPRGVVLDLEGAEVVFFPELPVSCYLGCPFPVFLVPVPILPPRKALLLLKPNTFPHYFLHTSIAPKHTQGLMVDAAGARKLGAFAARLPVSFPICRVDILVHSRR